jgi:hypothetical protein
LSVVCVVLSGRGLCDGLITRPEESYRPLRVVVCDQETSCTRRPWPALGCRARDNNIIIRKPTLSKHRGFINPSEALRSSSYYLKNSFPIHNSVPISILPTGPLQRIYGDSRCLLT